MRELTKEDVYFVCGTVRDVMRRNGIAYSDDLIANFTVEVKIDISVGMDRAAKAFNEMFHALGVLPKSEVIGIGDGRDYCATCVEEDGKSYCGLFNFPCIMGCKEDDEEYQYTLKAFYEREAAEAESSEAEELEEMMDIIDGIKAGRLKSKSPDGYLVLKAKFYDAIAAGKKNVEYRDFTEYNLKRTIGIKTVRFNRGYVKNAPQMRWEVEKVVLLDGDENECDPFNVPEDFWPVTIAIHLGKRI